MPISETRITAADAFEAALTKTLANRDALGEKLREARLRVFDIEERDRALVSLARRLATELPANRRTAYLRKFPWLSEGPDPASRQAVLFGIVQIFIADPDREFTTPDIEQLLYAQGIHANTKRIYNTLNYLAADGRLNRKSRGRYTAAPGLAPKPAEASNVLVP